MRFGTGVPFTRFSYFLKNLGAPIPRSTMSDLVFAAAAVFDPVLDELMRQAAQGELIYQDDTVMKILDRHDLIKKRGKGQKERKGTYTTGLIAKAGQHKVALFITGQQHAGENLADLLKLRSADLAKPIQMCDALAANTAGKLDTIVAHCLAHARRKFVEVVNKFPEECSFLLETLRVVYINDSARIADLVLKVYPNGLPQAQKNLAIFAAPSEPAIIHAAVRLVQLMAQALSWVRANYDRPHFGSAPMKDISRLRETGMAGTAADV
jgi:hypothetical protein